ncbi:MAG: transposase [Bradyrhizobium sp.]|nr:MAG: transposase [Bradyrhizobium sp.]
MSGIYFPVGDVVMEGQFPQRRGRIGHPVQRNKSGVQSLDQSRLVEGLINADPRFHNPVYIFVSMLLQAGGVKGTWPRCSGATRSGARWRDLPEAYVPRTTCYNRFVHWWQAGRQAGRYG